MGLGQSLPNKLIHELPNSSKEALLKKIAYLETTNKRLIQEHQSKDNHIANLERKLHKIGDAAEQRDWLLDELTKKITMIGEIRTDLLKRERLSAIGELSSRLAHDMRNPLSIILNTIDLIKMKHQDSLNPDVKNLFLMVDRATSRMAFQLDEVLNFVRSAPLEFEKKSLRDIITSSLYRIVIPDDIKIIKPTIDAEIDCDPRKLEAIFSNLVMNGIQAMNNQGTLTIRIFDDEQHVTIEVEDEGPGIPEKLTKKIFDPLFTTKSRGTGLGLATVKNMVEQHSGHVHFRQNPTVFSITLPRIQHKQTVSIP
ncbi:MAG: GHKL domain-containing protein [Crenarchaeota archaeon]|nr:MAG: GHKL domain-containing protein [Thermoproteota archaeon]RDJ32818.1 MAG: GHKL domain-containing protein [Thermoproteota archaeon]RDJ37988.1 MAG: GHKL domain-containing protein [Thermoproteota archaeon]RDJ38348.1 MAG: GHKL domain-containing protein [Thermoproteota archaeon]